MTMPAESGAPAPAPTPATTPPANSTTPAPAPAPDTGAEPTAEVEKWKTLARKHEATAKANANAARELATLRASTMTDTERAVQTARDEAAAEVRKSFGTRLVAAEVKAAAAGRDAAVVDGLLEGIDPARFLGDDGEPDTAAIKTWVDKVAPAAPAPPTPGVVPFPDLGQGVRPGAVAASPAADLATFLQRQLKDG